MEDNKPELPPQAIAALEQGRKIKAIKCTRAALGVGLKEAKEIVEQFIEKRPDVRNRLVSANAGNARIALKWLLIIILCGLIIYYMSGGSY